MVQLFKERESQEQITLPVITPSMHNPIESMGRIASHLRLSPEGTYRRPSDADFACRISSNVSSLRIESSLPLRFSRLLESL
ncbi:MAG: hypothetical protein ABH983_06125 [Candidatus Micrarchaeota archaeon]|nr:hypothetical protein [Candidatus Micrarchaeota archaeon]MBU1681453.1 hypothetical protein [Candidatus Micrarchaeota archaeon]